MKELVNNYYMFGIHTESSILLFGNRFPSIEEADKRSKEFNDSKELIDYYGVNEQLLFSPVKIFYANDLTENKIFYKNDLENYKNSFLKDKMTVIALRYPEANLKNIKDYIKGLNENDLRSLINDDNEYTNKVMKK